MSAHSTMPLEGYGLLSHNDVEDLNRTMVRLCKCVDRLVAAIADPDKGLAMRIKALDEHLEDILQPDLAQRRRDERAQRVDAMIAKMGDIDA